MRISALLSVAFLCLPVAAQTFVVDLNNGPGTDFTSLQAAVDGVPDGANLEVRAGIYFENILIDGKSLTLLGDGNVRVIPLFSSDFRIQGLAADQSVSVRGVRIDFSQAANPTISCRDNLGLVVLDDVADGRGAVQVINCASVIVRDSFLNETLNPFPGGLSIMNSTVAV